MPAPAKNTKNAAALHFQGTQPCCKTIIAQCVASCSTQLFGVLYWHGPFYREQQRRVALKHEVAASPCLYCSAPIKALTPDAGAAACIMRATGSARDCVTGKSWSSPLGLKLGMSSKGRAGKGLTVRACRNAKREATPPKKPRQPRFVTRAVGLSVTRSAGRHQACGMHKNITGSTRCKPTTNRAQAVTASHSSCRC